MALIKRDFQRNAPQKSSEAALAEMTGWVGWGRTGCPWMGTWEGGAEVGVARKGLGLPTIGCQFNNTSIGDRR